MASTSASLLAHGCHVGPADLPALRQLLKGLAAQLDAVKSLLGTLLSGEGEVRGQPHLFGSSLHSLSLPRFCRKAEWCAVSWWWPILAGSPACLAAL